MKVGVGLAWLIALQALVTGLYVVVTASHLADDARRRSSAVSRNVYEQGYQAVGAFSVLLGVLLAYGATAWWRGQRRGGVILRVVSAYETLGAIVLTVRHPNVRVVLTLLSSLGLFLIVRSAYGRAQTSGRSPEQQRMDHRRRVQAFDEGFGG
ncbi:MAG: hypothetical protein JWM40_909 [Frankiales bacterium]|nr:hypothetical protein [Frankiales bacterium]